MPGQPGAAGGLAGGGVGNPDSRYSWAINILKSLGVDGNKDTNALVTMVCWMQAENGQTANNPLGCTLQYKDSKPDPTTTSGLMIYTSKEDGAAATAINIKQGYPTIHQALTSNMDYLKASRVIAQTNWGTGGLVVTVAMSVKGSGGFNSAIYKSYAWRNVKTTGHSRWRDVPLVGGAIADAQSSVQNTYDAVTSGFGAVSDFLGKLTDPHTWYRVGQILMGAIAIGLGIFLLARGPATSIANGVVGAGSKAKGRRGSKAGTATAGVAEVTPVEAAAVA